MAYLKLCRLNIFWRILSRIEKKWCVGEQYELKRAEEREHILLGLKKALDHIDEIIP